MAIPDVFKLETCRRIALDQMVVAMIGVWMMLGFVPAQAQGFATDETVVYAREALLVPGQKPVKNVAIFIRGQRIQRIDYPVSMPSGDPEPLSGSAATRKVIDLSCCFLTPGLIDTQTHLQSQIGMPPTKVRLVTWTDADNALVAMVHAQRTLAAGFTTVRDMGSHGDAMYALRDAINQGTIMGPRIQVAGEIIMPTGGDLRDWFRPDVESLFETPAICDGPADCRRAVRELVALGSDTIKVATKMDLADRSPSQFTLDELTAMVDEAKRLGVKITASAFSVESNNLPLEAGVDAVVHGVYIDQRTIELLREKSAWYIPTLVAARTVKEMAEDPDSPFSQAWRDENLAIYHGMIDSFQRVRKAGLKIAFGTDAGWRPHGGNGEQLVQMTELGMSPADVIVTATSHAASAMGWEQEIGSLEAGKFADMVAVQGDPLLDITQLTRLFAVIKGGHRVDPQFGQ